MHDTKQTNDTQSTPTNGVDCVMLVCFWLVVLSNAWHQIDKRHAISGNGCRQHRQFQPKWLGYFNVADMLPKCCRHYQLRFWAMHCRGVKRQISFVLFHIVVSEPNPLRIFTAKINCCPQQIQQQPQLLDFTVRWMLRLSHSSMKRLQREAIDTAMHPSWVEKDTAHLTWWEY